MQGNIENALDNAPCYHVGMQKPKAKKKTAITRVERDSEVENLESLPDARKDGMKQAAGKATTMKDLHETMASLRRTRLQAKRMTSKGEPNSRRIPKDCDSPRSRRHA